jgi:hypothetical protein
MKNNAKQKTAETGRRNNVITFPGAHQKTSEPKPLEAARSKLTRQSIAATFWCMAIRFQESAFTTAIL